MNARSIPRLSRPPIAAATLAAAVLAALAAVGAIAAQSPAAAPLALLSKEGRRALNVSVVNDEEFVSLDDLASTFQLTVHEEAGAILVSYKGKTIVLTPDQALASVAGRLVSLPAPPSRSGRRWLVPVEFIGRALAPIYDQRLDLRKGSHLLVVGDLRVPHVVVRYDTLGAAPRLVFDATPRAAATVSQQNERLTIKFDADALDVQLPIVQPQGLVQAVHLVDAVTIGVELGPRFAAFRASTQSTDAVVADDHRFRRRGAARRPRRRPSPRRHRQPSRRSAQPSPAQPPATPAPAPPGAPAPPVLELPLPGQTTPSLRTIVIDPGHGGDDAGVVGAAGTKEKDVALAVARRLKSTIETRLGARVLLTRDDDRRVALDDRSALANNNKADLFLSLHANASFRPDGRRPADPLLVVRRGGGEGGRGRRRRRAPADLRRRLARDRLHALGRGADPLGGSIGGLRPHAAGHADRSRRARPAADRRRAAARPRIGEHAGRARGARLPDQRGAGTAARRARLPDVAGAGDLRCDPEVARLDGCAANEDRPRPRRRRSAGRRRRDGMAAVRHAPPALRQAAGGGGRARGRADGRARRARAQDQGAPLLCQRGRRASDRRRARRAVRRDDGRPGAADRRSADRAGGRPARLRGAAGHDACARSSSPTRARRTST